MGMLYVSNVSIIFDVPCLFYTNCYMFCIYFISLLYFFGTNLLTRCRSASSCFLLFLYSRKASLDIFSELDETWTDLLFFQHEDGVQRRDGGAPRGTHTLGPRGPPLPRRGVVSGPRGSAAAALSPSHASRRENPKSPSHYPRKVPETPPPSTLAREGPEPLPGTLPERGIVTGGFYIAMPASGVMRE